MASAIFTMKNLILFPAVTILLLACTCGNPIKSLTEKFNKAPEIDAVTKAIKACLPVAYAANCAMDALVRPPGAGVVVMRDADSFPCNAIVSITVSKAHPLPVGGDSTGTIQVLGLWADSNVAVMTIFFTNTNIKDGTFTLKNAAFVPATRDTGGTMVVFASEDINADSSTVVTTTITDSMVRVKIAGMPSSLPTDSAVAVNQKAWITVVKEPAGSGLGAETYDLYGASQYLGVNPSTVEVIQAVMLQVRLAPGLCRKNPQSGIAMIRDIKIQNAGSTASSGIELGTTVLTFTEDACSGRAAIWLATGVYIGRTGSTVTLNLDK
jgi:hypothetical protein